MIRHSQRGTTLAEVLVAMALMAILAASAVSLVRPTFSIYQKYWSRETARTIAQAVLDQLRGELLDAQGFLCLVPAGEDPDLVFTAGENPAQGNALFFQSTAGTLVLLDAGAVEQTALQAPQSDEGTVGPLTAGTLHRREFLREESGQWQTGEPDARQAWSCVELLPQTFYEDNTITLEFSVASSEEDLAQEGLLRVQALTAEVSVWCDGRVVAQRTAVLPLPKKPMLWQRETAEN